jgi:hypothetical protein
MPSILDGLADTNLQELKVKPCRKIDLSQKLNHPLSDFHSVDVIMVNVLHLEEFEIDVTSLTNPVEMADDLLNRPGVGMPVHENSFETVKMQVNTD